MKQTVCCHLLACVLLFAATIASADPDAYIVNTDSNSVSVIDTATNTPRPGSPIAIPQTNPNDPNNTNDGPFFIAINRTGTRAYIADASDDEIEVLDLTTTPNARLTPISLSATPGDPRTLAFKPNTDLLYVVLAGSEVRVIDTAAGGSGVLLPGSVNHNGGPTRIVFNGDGSRAYIGNRNDPNPTGNVAVINTTTTPGVRLGSPNDNIPVGPAPVDIVYDAGRNRLFTANFNDAMMGNADGNVSVIDITPGTDAFSSAPPITVAGFKPTSVVLNPDRSQIFVTQLSGTLSVFNNGASVSSTPAYSVTVGNLATIPTFRADGRIFVPNAGDNTVSVFDTSPTAATPVTMLTGAQTIGTRPRRIAIRETGTAGGAGTIQFSAATYTVGETGNAVVTVTRTGGNTGVASAQFATSNGTATSGSDYTAVTQAVNFPSGVMGNMTVSVPITPDTAVEANETVNLTLTAFTGATGGTPQMATLTIMDDDSAAPPPPAPAPAGDGGGGGGCTVNPSQTLDPTLLLLLLAGVIYLSRRTSFSRRIRY